MTTTSTTTSPHAAAGTADAGTVTSPVSPAELRPAAAAAAPLDGAWFALNIIEIGKLGLLR